MASSVFDVVVVGGGVAGSALGAALARAGLGVLVVERESRFRDRVRGDGIFPWGVVEMTRLGLADLLPASGAPTPTVAGLRRPSARRSVRMADGRAEWRRRLGREPPRPAGGPLCGGRRGWSYYDAAGESLSREPWR